MATPITAGAVAGEYMETLVILEWRVAPGDGVCEGDILLTVETAKAAVDVAAPHAGVVSAVYAAAGSEVPAASVLCLVGADASDVACDAGGGEGDGAAQPAVAASAAVADAGPFGPAATPSRIVASPAARRAARDAGVDLRSLRATSPSGRIKMRDVRQAAAAMAAPASPALPPDEPGPLKIHRSGAGDGVPVLMIHGFAGDAQSWYPLDRQLAQSHPVYRLELPNHGASPRRRVGSFAGLARAVREAFDALDLESAHVIGHSLGGALALALADTRPRKVSSLALFAPCGLGPGINGAFIGGIARASRPESLAAWLKVMVHDPRLVDPAFVHAVFAARSDPDLRAAQSCMGETLFGDGSQSFDLLAALRRLECPARIVWGRRDRVLDWHDALRAPGAIGLHLLDDVGHVPHLEMPDVSLAIVRSLIRGA